MMPNTVLFVNTTRIRVLVDFLIRMSLLPISLDVLLTHSTDIMVSGEELDVNVMQPTHVVKYNFILPSLLGRGFGQIRHSILSPLTLPSLCPHA